jgi:hypothetical protein
LFIGDFCSLFWLSIFFWVILVSMFVCCVQELFGHYASHFTHHILILQITFHFVHLHSVFFQDIVFLFIFLEKIL